MRRLILLRHAKSDWGAVGLDDHERPLNPRGRLAATLMGAYLRDEGLVPDIALVSSARRTRETWARMALDAAQKTLPTLYHAEPATILDAAMSVPDDAGVVLVLGHQPGMQMAANDLLGGWEVDEYPTAKLAVIDFDVESWADVAFGGGRLVREASPKTLV
ncbi:MAG: histidine phosphatase family protein [Pseudomonadota bacterium]